VRHGKRQRAAGERHVVRDQACAEFGEERSAPGEALAASTSHVSVELSCMRPIMWQGPLIVIIGTW
jgi:hypothetical protein